MLNSIIIIKKNFAHLLFEIKNYFWTKEQVRKKIKNSQKMFSCIIKINTGVPFKNTGRTENENRQILEQAILIFMVKKHRIKNFFFNKFF